MGAPAPTAPGSLSYVQEEEEESLAPPPKKEEEEGKDFFFLLGLPFPLPPPPGAAASLFPLSNSESSTSHRRRRGKKLPLSWGQEEERSPFPLALLPPTGVSPLALCIRRCCCFQRGGGGGGRPEAGCESSAEYSRNFVKDDFRSQVLAFEFLNLK